MMPDDLFTPEETAVIQRLRNAPQPRLKPQAFGAIYQRLVQELALPSEPVAQTPPRAIPVMRVMAAIGVVVIVVIIAASLLTAQRRKPPTIPTNTSAAATATSAPSVPAGETGTGNATQPELQPTQDAAGSTIQATASATSGVTAGGLTPASNGTAAVTAPDTILVLEGPVQKINPDGITVFSMELRLDPADPILRLIQVGTMVHVEGYPEVSNGVTVIIVVTIDIQNNNPAVSTGLPPNCKMSKNGHIKCSKKKK